MNDDDFNDLDELMARVSEAPLLASPEDIDRVIAYQRKLRAQREAGVKTRKPKGESKPTISIEELLAQLPQTPKVSSGIKRRF